MHMADAMVSPAVGLGLWTVSGTLLVLSARRVKLALRAELVPLMGVLGAFIFAAQMVNFAIPGTGSSGHLGGGLLLAVLLGPHAAFIVLASVLSVQALFFADGGLLALGCNMFNLAGLPCFVAYPLIYRMISRGSCVGWRAWWSAIVAAFVGLQLGAFCVVLEVAASGIAALPFGAFVSVMQSIHAVIGVIEGVATAVVVSFVARARPGVLFCSLDAREAGGERSVVICFLVAAVLLGGGISWFASSQPDGLEWSVSKALGNHELPDTSSGLHSAAAGLQAKVSLMPDYELKRSGGDAERADADRGAATRWPAINGEATLAGLLGGALVLCAISIAGLILRARLT